MKFSDYNTIVIKLGSSLIIDSEKNSLRTEWLEHFAKEVGKLRLLGLEVVIVCSGAIASAARELGKNRSELSLSELQAYAAYGQALLISDLQKIFKANSIDLAQILITNADCQNRRRYLNMRATISKLLDMNIVPVINENDTIATDEIKFGDNDVLAARVVALTDADLLVLLSDINGLYDSNPKDNDDAKLIRKIAKIDEKILALASSKTNLLGTGGIKSKIRAAGIANNFGADVVLAKGEGKNSVFRLEYDKDFSFFVAKQDGLNSRKKWLSGLENKGEVVVNKGAADIIEKGGSSLLPIGVTDVRGVFSRGDMILVLREDGVKIAQGLSGVTSREAKIYQGKDSKEIKLLVKKPIRLNIIHYDNMLLLK